ncbi:MAG: RagB/SusD family nutrient uptake outer membrane protein [Bacteroidota bacterium]
MTTILKLNKYLVLFAMLLLVSSCNDYLNEPQENLIYTRDIDYTDTQNMIMPLIGAYADFQSRGWEDIPLIAVRGDDVNAGGLGDQQDYAETDKFKYNKDYWMYNSAWLGLYSDVVGINSAIGQIEQYKQYAANKSLADQYISEAKVLRGFLLLQLSRVWGSVFIPAFSGPVDNTLYTKQQVMEHIIAQMDEAIPNLPDLHPKQRSDIRGGVTRYTALAVKAIANLELKNYQGVADATSQIISSQKFSLEPDFYKLFKIHGKLSNENILEIQYSDFGKGTGDNISHLFAFYGPQNWTPKVAQSGSGWGFFEPSLKYIKFMLDRNETVRLETSVLFTNRGIAEIQKDSKYATLPTFVSNTTRSGDRINDYPRALFASGKHYLPSEELTPGRTDYGTNKNYIVIRYAEILLMHAEALTRGASSSAMTADAAVNLVRARAGLTPLNNVTSAQVMDEKYAELAMEWGIRFYDMVRLERYSDLSYEGRTFNADLIYLPYPQAQVDQIPALKEKK